jgi:serine protease AprX
MMGGTMDYSHQYLLLPKGAVDEPQESMVATRRGFSDLGVTLTAVPRRNAAQALNRVGLKASAPIPGTGPQDPEKGAYSILRSLRVTTATFASERQQNDAIHELGDQFDFVRDGAMVLPEPVAQGQDRLTLSEAALSVSEWPEESGVAKAHAKGIRGGGVLMGVLDTGIDADHGEFSHKQVVYRFVPLNPFSEPRNIRGFDTDGHGTHVSGIIAGKSVGVAPEVGLYVASVIESETLETSLSRVLQGLDWLLSQFSTPENQGRPGIISMSIGFPKPGQEDTDYQYRLKLMRKTLSDLRTHANVLPVIAIGNDGPNRYRYPGAFKEVLGVGAVDFNKKIADFSGGGDPVGEDDAKPNICGYGVGVYSSLERSYDGQSIYTRMSGTSMATPYVAGLAALYRSALPLLRVDEVENLLYAHTVPVQPGARGGKGLAVYAE